MSHYGNSRRLSDVFEARESIELDLPIQLPSRPSTPPLASAPLVPVIDYNTGAMDEEVERYLVSQALQIGAEIPPGPGSSKQGDDADAASINRSALTVSSTQDSNTIPSRTSQSTRPTSCSSSVKNDVAQPPPQRPARQVRASHSFRRAPSSSAASVAESTSSTSSKLMKGFRRLSSLSSFSRRKPSTDGTTNGAPGPGRPSIDSTRSDAADFRRPPTADFGDASDRHGGRDYSTGSLNGRSRSLNRAHSSASRSSSAGAQSLPPNGPAYPSASARQERAAAAAADRAKRRTLQSPRLQSLRLRQLDEQGQFLDYHTSLLEGIRARSGKDMAVLAAAYEQSKDRLDDSHTQVHASLEDRHLAAEMELSRALQQERQACDTRLKHMDAYCNGRLSVVDGTALPRRKVTDEDYRKLVQQYQVRRGMDNLHEARINVLRKKQAKQAERVAQRQQAEHAALHKNFETERRRKHAAAQREEDDLRHDFESKRERLAWRWKLMETVERKKLEMETDLAFGELPDLLWGQHELIKA